MRSDKIEYITINDFSPGVVNDYRVITPSGPIGAGHPRPSQEAVKPGMAMSSLRYGTNHNIFTKGYYANNNGKLVPLPYPISVPNPGLITMVAGDTYEDTAGFIAVPTQSGGIAADDLFQFVHVVNSTPKDALRVFRNGVNVKTHVGAGATAGPPRGITRFLSRGQRAGFSTPGGPELFYEWTSGEPHTNGSTMFYEVWPDPNAVAVDGTYEETGVVNNATFLLGGQIVGHDGRVLRFCEQNHSMGTHGFFSNERVRNTDPPNSVSLTSTTTDSIVDPQTPNTYGAWGSLTYGELLLIKQFGGAILVEGDIYAPQITRLPGVQSTGSLMSETAWSAQGLVYMTDDGPYVWGGGSNSRRLGWPAGCINVMSSNSMRLGGSGICCSVMPWNNLVIFSGGAVWDSITDAWFCLQDAPLVTSIGYWTPSPTLQSTFYGIDTALDINGKLEFIKYVSDAGGRSNEGTWISLPIPVAYDTVDIVSVELSLGFLPSTTPSTVTANVSFLDIDGNLVNACNFNFSNVPQGTNQFRLRMPCGVRASFCLPYLDIINTAGDLPTVNAITIGYREAGSVGQV